MSCNGCRVLRKGCSDSCVLRPSLSWIPSSDSQSHATLFLAKFFGRAALLSFISSVPDPQRPDLFRSLLFEACGRTVSPVHGAVGLLWSGNWRICQEAVETVLRGGTILPVPELLNATSFPPISTEDSSEADDGSCTFETRHHNNNHLPAPRKSKRKKPDSDSPVDLDHSLNTGILNDLATEADVRKGERRRPGTNSRSSEESVTMTACFESAGTNDGQPLLNLFY